MPEWAANTPWWVVVGIIVSAGYAVVKFVRWTGRVDTRLDDLTTGLADARADIKKILERLFSRSTVEAHSPIQLTDFGREISAATSANEWARTNAPNLENEAAGKEEFEVFELCVSYVERLYQEDSEFERTVRSTAYERGIEPEQILKVYQVELRDRLLPAYR